MGTMIGSGTTRRTRRLLGGTVAAGILALAAAGVVSADLGTETWFDPGRAAVGDQVRIVVSPEFECAIQRSWLAPDGAAVDGVDDPDLVPLTVTAHPDAAGAATYTFVVPSLHPGAFRGYSDCGSGPLTVTANPLVVVARPRPPATDTLTVAASTSPARPIPIPVLALLASTAALVVLRRRKLVAKR